MPDLQVPATKRVITRFQLERGLRGAILLQSDWGRPSLSRRKVKPPLHCPVRQPTTVAQEKRHVGGRRQSRQAWGRRRLCCFEQRSLAVNFDLDQRARVRSFVWICTAPFSQKCAVGPSHQWATTTKSIYT